MRKELSSAQGQVPFHSGDSSLGKPGAEIQVNSGPLGCWPGYRAELACDVPAPLSCPLAEQPCVSLQISLTV